MKRPASDVSQSAQNGSEPVVVKGWLNRLKVGPKITLGYALTLAIAIIGTATGVTIGNQYQQVAEREEEHARTVVELLSKIQTNALQARTHQQQLIPLVDIPGGFEEEYEEAIEHGEIIEELEGQLAAFLLEQSEEGHQDASIEAVAKFVKIYEGDVALYLKGLTRLVQEIDINALESDRQIEDARQQLMNFSGQRLSVQHDTITHTLTDLINDARGAYREAKAESESAAVLRDRLIALSMVVSSVLAALMAIAISRTILKPLKEIEDTALSLTQNDDLDLRATVSTRDEIGTVAIAFNKLVARVSDRTQNLEQARSTLELRVKERTQELNSIIDNLGDGLLVVNPEGRITRANPALHNLFETNGKTIKGQLSQKIFDAEINKLIAQNQAHPQKSIGAELALSQDRTGQALVTSIISRAKEDAEPVQSAGSVVLIRDITAEKEVDQMKTDFISTVSHELRTPLTSVLGFAKLIQKKLEKTVLPAVAVDNKKTERAVRQVKDNLNIIVSEGERLTSLINDVLDIAKIEAGKIEWNMQPVAVSEVIERAITATSVLAQNSSLSIVQEIEPGLPEVTGDRDRLMQVAINLLSNAIKFTDSGTVTCKAYQQGSDITISIVDTGMGLAEDDLEKVFEKFKQVGEVMTDKPQGTGLGLPICKQIVEHHKGRIWAEANADKGSTFSFSLPMSVSAETEATKVDLQTLVKEIEENVSSPVVADEDIQKTILVVDDEPHIRQLLRQELESEGYRIVEAEDGIDAIKQVKTARPSLIIMDVMMPNISGFDLAAVFKNDPNTMDIPTIVVSIIQEPERGYRLGVDRYLSKPIDTQVLLKDVKELLTK